MSTVNKQSLREEAERIKIEFNQLILDHKINQESKMLFQSMLMLINLLISIFLERTTTKNNKNSSKPSSQTEKDKSSTINTGSNSNGKPESNATANNTRTVEIATVAKVINCHICGQDLTKSPCQGHERRTKIDIIFEKVVEHTDAEIKYCSNCEVTVKGKFPAELSGPLQ
jgi:transposase